MNRTRPTIADRVRRAALALGFALLVTATGAQGVSVRAAIEPETVSLGEAAVFSLTLTSPQGTPPTIQGEPPLPDALLIQRRGSTTRGMNISGNSTVHSTTQMWEVVPQREGTIRIPPISVEIDGTPVASSAVELAVMPAPSADLLAGTPLANPVPAVPRSTLAQFDRAQYDRDLSAFRNRLYLLVCADNPEPFVGEQVNISIYLINGNATRMEEVTFDQTFRSGVPMLDLVAHQPPQRGFFGGGWSPMRQGNYFQVADPLGTGAPVLAHLVRRVAMWPTAAGEVALGELRAHAAYQPSGWRRLPEVVFTTAPLTLHVRPLPGVATGTATVPVGRGFALSATLTPTELAYDEAATLRVRLDGAGLPRWFSLPTIDGGDLFSAEPPPTLPDPTTEIRGDRIGGRREFEFLVRFNRTGPLILPPVEYTVFDTAVGDFVTLRTEPIEVNVSARATEAAREITGVRLSDPLRPAPLAITGDVLFEIETTGFDVNGHASPLATQTPAGWALLLLPTLCLGAAAVFDRRRARLRGEAGFTLRSRRRAARRLRQAERALRHGDADAFHTALAAAVHDHLAHHLGAPTRGCSWPEVDRLLDERGVDDEVRERLSRALTATEFARFAPGADTATAERQLLDDTVAALRALGRGGKGR